MSNFGRTTACAALAAAALVACGADRAGGPKGDPTAIVTKAPDLTVAAGHARVAVATPDAAAEGTIDFVTGQARVQVRPPTARQPELTNPGLGLDVVRAAASVRPYGGAEVRGASTIKYELDVVLNGKTQYADVFIDSQGRIRRVSVPIDPNERRPSRANRILAKLVTIDYYDFGRPPP